MKKITVFIAAAIFFINTGFSQMASIEDKMYRVVPLPIMETAAYKKLNSLQQDIAYLFALIEDGYPNWQAKIKPVVFQKLKADLINRFAKDSSKQNFDIAVQKVLSSLIDAHSQSSLPFISTEVKKSGLVFPLTTMINKTDLFIRNISKNIDSSLIGSKITAINGMAMPEVLKKIKAIESCESAEGSLFRFASNKLNSPVWLYYAQLATNMDSLSLRLEKNGTTSYITLLPEAKPVYYSVLKKTMATGRNAKGFYYEINKEKDYAFLQINTMMDYEVIKEGIGQYVDAQTLPMALAYMKSQHEKAGTLNFNTFIIAAMDSIRKSGVKNLVLDLRNNGGGDMRIPKQLLYLLDIKKPVKEFTTLKKMSSFYQYAMNVDFAADSNAWYKATGKSLTSNGKIYNIDRIVKAPEYYDFFYAVKQKHTPFYISDSIPKYTGNLYVLTAFQTGSAAMITATTIADNKLGKIVGLPTGNQPTNATGASNCKLPNSGINFSLSYLIMKRPDTKKDKDIYLNPDVLIWRNMDKLNNGVDEHLEWVINDIKQKQ